MVEVSKSTKRVILIVSGGLGNQFFQYAAGFSLAHRNDAELLIDSTSGFEADPYERSYALGHFGISAKLIGKTNPDTLIVWKKLYWKYRELLRLRYSGRTFDPAAFDRKFQTEALLEGYYQSPHYFTDYADSVRREFKPRTEVSPETRAVAQQIHAAPSVAVHIRKHRGASASGKLINKRAISSDSASIFEYYNAALELLISKRRSIHCFLFSDCPEWAQRAIPGNLPKTIVSHNGIKRDYEDLYLMTLCRDHVIGQSTFSWWGAYLSSQPAQIAIAPKYFVPGFRELTDVYPKQWLVL